MNVSPLKSGSVLAMALCAFMGAAHAGSTVYRCGNEYINDADEAKRRGCKVMEGGNLTVIEGTKPAARSSSAGSGSSASSSRPSTAPRVTSDDQRKRDSDARAILERELESARVRLEDARKEYAGGSPEKMGPEARNHQMYLDRVAKLKEAVDRAESDVASIQRELERLN